MSLKILDGVYAGTAQPASGGGSSDTTTITATNKTGAAVSSGDKVWVSGTNIVPFETSITNVNTAGTVSINNTTKIASSFSNSNYLTLKNTFTPDSKKWEIVVKFKPTTAMLSQSVDLVFKSYNNLSYNGIRIRIYSEGKIYYIVSPVFDYTGTVACTPDVWNWVKLEFTGSAYVMSRSLDGTTWTNEHSYTSSSTLGASSDLTCICHNNHDTNNEYFDGEIDLQETRFTIDGSYTCRLVDATPIANSSSVEGVAKEDIAVNASGSVKVLA